MAFKLTINRSILSVYPVVKISNRLSFSEQKPVMQNKSVIFLFLCAQFLATSAGTAWSQSSIEKCVDQLSPLKKTKDTIIGDGGMWGIFERHKVLRDESSKAIQLDNKIQQVVWLLDYLCTTADGVPLNELATYLNENLKEKSKPQFKKELIILGKSEAEIDLWFVFSETSLKNKNRKLDIETICTSIQKVHPLLQKYKTLAKEVDQSPNEKQIENVDALYQEIEQLESSDSYLAQALHETSQVPHWDIDESTGGS
jgi:hypothetical protein